MGPRPLQLARTFAQLGQWDEAIAANAQFFRSGLSDANTHNDVAWSLGLQPDLTLRSWNHAAQLGQHEGRVQFVEPGDDLLQEAEVVWRPRRLVRRRRNLQGTFRRAAAPAPGLAPAEGDGHVERDPVHTGAE